jgi:lactoylglutathione lyase
MPVRQLRLVVTAADYDEAVYFYRDVLGLTERDAVQPPQGRVMILDAGAATLEIAEPATADFIDEVEVGRRVAGHIRVAFQVDDVVTSTSALAAVGGDVLAEPRRTPFGSTNSRLTGPAGLQLTLFELD